MYVSAEKSDFTTVESDAPDLKSIIPMTATAKPQPIYIKVWLLLAFPLFLLDLAITILY